MQRHDSEKGVQVFKVLLVKWQRILCVSLKDLLSSLKVGHLLTYVRVRSFKHWVGKIR